MKRYSGSLTPEEWTRTIGYYCNALKREDIEEARRINNLLYEDGFIDFTELAKNKRDKKTAQKLVRNMDILIGQGHLLADGKIFKMDREEKNEGI